MGSGTKNRKHATPATRPNDAATPRRPDAAVVAAAVVWQLHRRGVDPCFARLHHRAEPLSSPTAVAAQLDSLSGHLAVHVPTVGSILAGAAFGGTSLPGPTRARFPSDEEFDACVATATAWVTAFEAARTTRRHDMAFGLDVKAASPRTGPAQVAQFIVAAPAAGAARLVAAKRMPSPSEGSYVYLWPEDHNLPLVTPLTGLGDTLPLVCHEATAFNHRAVANTTAEWRVDRRAAIQADVLRGDVTCLYNAIHRLWTDGEVTFHTSYNAILDEREGLRIVGAFGSALDVSVAEAMRLAGRLTRGFSGSIEAFPSNW